MHITTKALVLRTVDYKETDKILTLLTQDQGKLTASARGCRKKGSAIAAGCQLLAWSEMVLYDYQGRWSVKEAATQRLFQGVRNDIVRLALGCYFAEVAELLARVDVVLRRFRQTDGVMIVDGLTVDTLGRRVMRDGQEIPLTKTEYELLLLLMRNPGRALTREAMYEQVWGQPFRYGTKTVDLHVQRMRKKVKWEEKIVAVNKVGYRFEA